MLAAFAILASASAHDFSQSESTIDIDGRAVRVQFSVNLLELPDVDTSGDGRVSYDELDRAIERVVGLVKGHFAVRAPDEAGRIAVDRYDFVDDHVLRMDMRYEFDHRLGAIDVTSTIDALAGPMHQHFLTARVNGELVRAVLDAANRSTRLDPRRVTPGRLTAVGLAALALGVLAAFRWRARQKTGC